MNYKYTLFMCNVYKPFLRSQIKCIMLVKTCNFFAICNFYSTQSLNYVQLITS